MTDRTDALIDKIRKLRAKAEDSSVTEAEASAYATKVAELLAQHGLDEAALEMPEQSDVAEEQLDDKYMTDPWRRAICLSAARLYFCSGYTYQSYTRHDPARHPPERNYEGLLLAADRRSFVTQFAFRFVGRRHNAVIAKEMSTYLIATTCRLALAFRREYSASRAEYLDFARGCAARLSERLDALYWQQRRAAAPRHAANGNPGNLPALYADEETLIAKWIEANLALKAMRGGGISEGGWGSDAGRRAADTVSLSAQVAGSSTRMLR
jgi:hypothetical protein